MQIKAGDVLRNPDDSPVLIEGRAVKGRDCRFALDGEDITHLAIREADEEAGVIVVIEEVESPKPFRKWKIENGQPVLKTLSGRVQIIYGVS